MNHSPQASLLLSNSNYSWKMVPPIGNLNAYISAINRIPLLTLEQEQDYSKKLRDNNDLEAASKLVLSHLRLVVSVSRQYLGYGLPHEDLIQEGNIGLMEAVKRFNPDAGVRLVSYSLYWIKGKINEYILKNWRMVKVVTNKAQRKLFFNLRSLKQSYKNDEENTYKTTLNNNEIDTMSAALGVKRENVVEMEARLAGGDVMLDSFTQDDEEVFGHISYLSDTATEPTNMIESFNNEWLSSEGISLALSELDDRSRFIIENRWLNVNDDGSGGMTLHDLSIKYGISKERVRQIEAAALKKMKKNLEEFI